MDSPLTIKSLTGCQNKSGKLVQFVINRQQDQIITELDLTQNNLDSILLKQSQGGFARAITTHERLQDMLKTHEEAYQILITSNRESELVYKTTLFKIKLK